MSELETKKNAPSDVTILVLGIIGLALAIASGLPGLIVSIIGLKKAKEYTDCGLVLEGKASIGQKLARAGKIVGIITTILYVVVIVIEVIVIIATAAADIVAY